MSRTTTGLLRGYAALLKRLSAAESVSLYAPEDESGASLLLHEGEPPVMELASAEAAERFAREHEVDRDGPGAQRLLDSAESPGWLVAVPCAPFSALPPEDERRKPRAPQREGLGAGAEVVCWLGFEFESTDSGRSRSVDSRQLLTGASVSGLAGPFESLLGLGGVLAWYARQVSAILDDPVTGLAGRAEFQATLGRALEEARSSSRPLSLLFVNPDDFTAVNERFGHEAGDAALREIGERLRWSHRSTDTLAKYGGAIFASCLSDTDAAAARVVAEKIWSELTRRPYLQGELRLPTSIGVAVFEPGDASLDGHLELIRRADKALHAAKRYGGDHVVLWASELESQDLGSVDRLTGVYTGNMAKDYRNMTLLSDTMSVVAGSDETMDLVRQMVQKLHSTLKADHVGIFEWSEDGEAVLLGGVTRRASPGSGTAAADGLELPRNRAALVGDAKREGRAIVATFADEYSDDRVLAFAVPLLLNERAVGVLYLDGRLETLALEGASDLGFLRAFATQLAVALDRARLSEHRKQRVEQERSRLREELDGLRAAMSRSRLVYCSREMDAVLATVRRVAPTKATVLVIGESGTGKELVARTLHELSPFAAKPLVVVDCGAIPTTLIESELFGHERGAYTGAEERRVGRLLEAEGGTVVLDEVGELPLEVQSKLLRFVQERQIVPVGGTRVHRVDTRLVAVTHRELSVEAAEGRFREDLYHRLNVVRVTVPPLRERREDIPYLAKHFLEQFARQYQKDGLELSPGAMEVMERYRWPGNVRELQNRLLQAAILAESPIIGVDELGLESASSDRSVSSEPRTDPTGSSTPPVERVTSFAHPEEAWGAVRRALEDLIERARRAPAEALPLGTWLSEDLVLEAFDAADEVAGRARLLLGVAETTFRRKLTKALTQKKTGLLTRRPPWDQVRPLLARLVRTPGVSGADVLETARRLLLDEVAERVEDPAVGAALMGVTLRTYQRWRQSVERSSFTTSIP